MGRFDSEAQEFYNSALNAREDDCYRFLSANSARKAFQYCDSSSGIVSWPAHGVPLRATSGALFELGRALIPIPTIRGKVPLTTYVMFSHFLGL